MVSSQHISTVAFMGIHAQRPLRWRRRVVTMCGTRASGSDMVSYSLGALNRLVTNDDPATTAKIGDKQLDGMATPGEDAMEVVYVPVQEGKRNFILSSSTSSSSDLAKSALFLCRDQVRDILHGSDAEMAFLGCYDGKRFVAIDVEDPSLLEQAFHGAHAIGRLPQISQELQHDELAILAYARGLMWFHQNTKFCARCGSSMQSTSQGKSRTCIACSHRLYPRVDPAIITLVTKGDRCLLGRKRSWPVGRYSCLAGFVEIGETLEDAIGREVKEESGVEVDVRTVSYCGSQPWPFPQSLMIGFRCEALSEEVTVDPHELEDARWFDRDFVRQKLADGPGDAEFNIPSKTALANRIINNWIRG